MDPKIILTIPGSRMDIRIVETRFERYTVQYLYSRDKNIWKNFIWIDYRKGSIGERQGGLFFELADAKRAAKAKHRDNN